MNSVENICLPFKDETIQVAEKDMFPDDGSTLFANVGHIWYQQDQV